MKTRAARVLSHNLVAIQDTSTKDLSAWIAINASCSETGFPGNKFLIQNTSRMLKKVSRLSPFSAFANSEKPNSPPLANRVADASVLRSRRGVPAASHIFQQLANQDRPTSTRPGPSATPFDERRLV